MDIFDNPFHILGATPQDNIRTIENLAEERSLLSDDDACMKARSILTNPRNRISAEVSWLPCVNPTRVGEMLMLLESSAGNHFDSNNSTSIVPVDSLAAALSRLTKTASTTVADEVLELLIPLEKHSIGIGNLNAVGKILGIDDLKPITRANLLAARMSRLPNNVPDDVAKWIITIAQVYESINPEDVQTILNAERNMSGFPEITSISDIAVEIQNRRSYYNQVIKTVLNKIYSAKERLDAVNMVIHESSIVTGKNRKPLLIDDTIDAYAVKTTPLLENEEKNIETQVQKLRYAADTIACDTTFSSMVDKLIQAVKNWHIMAQPILLKKKRMGFRDSESHRVAMDVRRLAIYLINEHDKLYISQQILIMLQEVFAEVPEIVERITSDLETLNKKVEQREEKK